MPTYITTDAEGNITASADWEFPDSRFTNKEVVRGKNGQLYFEDSIPPSQRINPLEVTVNAELGRIDATLAALDAQSARPLRAILSGVGTEYDENKLKELEQQAAVLREERALWASQLT